jgi:hypothetical protein
MKKEWIMRFYRLCAAFAALLLLAVLPIRVSASTSGADLVTTMSGGCCGSYGPVSYTATVTNKGPDAAQNLVVTDTYGPARFVSLGWTFGIASCTYPPVGGIACKAGSLASGGVAYLTVTVRPMCLGGNQLLSNNATASASNANTSSAGITRRCSAP